MLQERVREHTEMLRQRDMASGMTPEEAQQVVEEYDPVVAMAIVAVDARTPRDTAIKCNAEVAQYVRPKLKSVEMAVDPDALETLEERRQLSQNLVALLQAAAGARKKSGKK